MTGRIKPCDIAPTRLVLGILYPGPATRDEVIEVVRRIQPPGCLNTDEVHDAINYLIRRGLVTEERGQLILHLDRLHPRIEESIAEAYDTLLELIGIQDPAGKALIYGGPVPLLIRTIDEIRELRVRGEIVDL